VPGAPPPFIRPIGALWWSVLFLPSLRRSLSALTLAALALAPSSLAAQQLDFQHSICFGDSLTNNDFLGLVYGKPQSLYQEDPFEAVFKKARQSGNTLNSYALAGAQSRQLATQIDTYEFFEFLGLAPTATLFHIEMGGNDFFANELLLGAYAPGVNAQADAVVNRLLQRIESALKRLRGRKGVEVILWTVPDITLTPGRMLTLNAQQRANIQAHLKRCNDRIRAFRGRPRVAVLDFVPLQRFVVSNPPVIQGNPLIPPPAFGDYDHIHADDVHPTAVGNALIANAMIQLLNQKFGESIPFYSEQELADLARF